MPQAPTPGPWTAKPVPAGAATDAPIWIEANGRRIADVRDQGAETAANAALIADAPALLAALAIAGPILADYAAGRPVPPGAGARELAYAIDVLVKRHHVLPWKE